jgi:hypothetical protein
MPLYVNNASSIHYNPDLSDLNSINVQDALDEISNAVNIEINYPNVIKTAQMVMDASLTIQNNSGLRISRPNGSIEMVRFIGSSTVQNTGSLTISSNGSMRVIGV